MQVLPLFRPIWMGMISEMCGIGHLSRRVVMTARHLVLLWVCCVGLCVSTGTVYANEVDSLFFNRLLHFGTNVPDAFKAAKSETNLNGDTSNSGGIQVLSLGYRSLAKGGLSSAQVAVIVAQEAAIDAAIAPEVIGKALFYPNPARQEDDAKLGYQLSKNMDIELEMYDMMANRIFKNTFLAGTNGGKAGYNKLKLDLDTFSGYFLSAGVYFYLLMHDGKVLAKGKVAVIP